jgi:hypothetical protein
MKRFFGRLWSVGARLTGDLILTELAVQKLISIGSFQIN